MGPSSILWEEFFFIQIPFKEEMRQMEKNNKNKNKNNNNNNLSNSLVFGRWSQTKRERERKPLAETILKRESAS